jgi:Zn-dependent M28 family amino/carboxypeptidase
MLSLETIGYYSDDQGSQRYPFPMSLFYPKVGDFIAFVGNTRSGELVRRVVASFRRHARFPSQGAALPAFIREAGFSDHWAFWKAGYPGLMVTDTALYRYPLYHTSGDTPDQLRYDRMARVVAGLEGVVLELAGPREPTAPAPPAP